MLFWWNCSTVQRTAFHLPWDSWVKLYHKAFVSDSIYAFGAECVLGVARSVGGGLLVYTRVCRYTSFVADSPMRFPRHCALGRSVRVDNLLATVVDFNGHGRVLGGTSRLRELVKSSPCRCILSHR